jgi:hypothetical protein
MESFADLLHHIVDNCAGFVQHEAVRAHELITDEFGGDRHYTVPDPEDPEAGKNDPDQSNIDPRDAELERLRALRDEDAQRESDQETEIERLRAELAARDTSTTTEADNPSATIVEPSSGTQDPDPAA